MNHNSAIAISTPTAVAKAWKQCRGTVVLNKTCWKLAGSVHEASFDLSGLVQTCIGYLCWPAAKWISHAFTISLRFWEPAWEEKAGIANVKMLILCWKDWAKRSLFAQCLLIPSMPRMRAALCWHERHWACLPSTRALLFSFQAELE